MNILCLGKILHEMVLRDLAQLTASLPRGMTPDVILAGGDQLLGHAGSVRRLAEEWPDAGLHFLILSDVALSRPMIRELLPSQSTWIRPVNLPPGAIGHRYAVWQKEQERLAIVSVVTDSDRSIDDAFQTMDGLVKTDLQGVPILVLAYGSDLAMKQALFWKLRQQQAPVHVLGLGLGVSTADERIDAGRGWIADIGTVGREGGIAGCAAETWWQRYRDRIPVELSPPPGRLRADALMLELTSEGRATKVSRICLGGESR